MSLLSALGCTGGPAPLSVSGKTLATELKERFKTVDIELEPPLFGRAHVKPVEPGARRWCGWKKPLEKIHASRSQAHILIIVICIVSIVFGVLWLLNKHPVKQIQNFVGEVMLLMLLLVWLPAQSNGILAISLGFSWFAGVHCAHYSACFTILFARR